ncbi:MAG: hypothetical protein JWQ42_126 [Edaphobacter sp.]|nr:hypothetical protein [Edaphobacter sp.]
MNPLVITNPKRRRKVLGRESWYSYYAGFSEDFAKSIITSASLPKDGSVLDPWNGSGTTTSAASGFGFNSFGFDINPVSVVLARGRLFARGDIQSVEPLCKAIRINATRQKRKWPGIEEPLDAWFTAESSSAIRALDLSIRNLLMNESCRSNFKIDVDALSTLAAFFYVALFRSIRALLESFLGTNPTWIKKATCPTAKIAINPIEIGNAFQNQIERLLIAIADEKVDSRLMSSQSGIALASSDQIPVRSGSIDIALSSPPYCTRIDYGIATLPELAVLGIDTKNGLRQLREKLIGTPTIKQHASRNWSESWGPTCEMFLSAVKSHQSRASESYYLKTHEQYFEGIANSLTELSRCLKTNGRCVLVVQDSYYKELYNNLPLIFIEMASQRSLKLDRREDFHVSRTLAGIQPHTKQYRKKFSATESVLCFIKEEELHGGNGRASS